MFGEVEATIRGALWPYFAVTGYQAHRLSTDTSLSDSEYCAGARSIPASADDLQPINKLIDAAAKHEESMTIKGQTMPVYRLGEMENPYRQAVVGYDTAIAGLLAN